MNVLITGGAGFIGSRVAVSLAASGHDVTVVDCLSEQVHGQNPNFPSRLRDIRCIYGSVLNRDLMRHVLRNQEVLIHLAAETGTGQSMYRVSHYESVNIGGTATLMDILVNDRVESLSKMVVASSRAVYGEGLYNCEIHGAVYPLARSRRELDAMEFEPKCPACGGPVLVDRTP